MIPLRAIFKFNKLEYKLLRRNEYVALYGIGGTPEKEAERFEVFRIQIEDYGEGTFESIPSNNLKQIRESYQQCFNDYKSALFYYICLSAMVKRYMNVLKVVTDVTEKVEIVS
jgi:hypothetical protein